MKFELIEDKDYKIGDYVEVINSGALYSQYITLFHKVGFKNNKTYNDTKISFQGKIFHICRHEEKSESIIIFIRDNNGNEIAIDKEGIKMTLIQSRKIKLKKIC
jgi:hypothetical protein